MLQTLIEFLAWIVLACASGVIFGWSIGRSKKNVVSDSTEAETFFYSGPDDEQADLFLDLKGPENAEGPSVLDSGPDSSTELIVDLQPAQVQDSGAGLFDQPDYADIKVSDQPDYADIKVSEQSDYAEHIRALSAELNDLRVVADRDAKQVAALEAELSEAQIALTAFSDARPSVITLPDIDAVSTKGAVSDSTGSARDSADETIAQLREQVIALSSDSATVYELEQKIETLEVEAGQLAGMKSQVAATQEQLSDAQRELSESQKELSESQTKISEMTCEIARLNTEVEGLGHELARGHGTDLSESAAADPKVQDSTFSGIVSAETVEATDSVSEFSSRSAPDPNLVRIAELEEELINIRAESLKEIDALTEQLVSRDTSSVEIEKAQQQTELALEQAAAASELAAELETERRELHHQVLELRSMLPSEDSSELDVIEALEDEVAQLRETVTDLRVRLAQCEAAKF